MTSFVRFIAPMPPYTTLTSNSAVYKFWLDTTTHLVYALYLQHPPMMLNKVENYDDSGLYGQILTIIGEA